MADDVFSAFNAFHRATLQPGDVARADALLEQLVEDLRRIYAEDDTAPDLQAGAGMDTASTIIRQVHAIRAAETEVAPFVGAVLGMDSASGVYREALRRLGHDTHALHSSATKVMFRTLRGAGARPRVAMDDAGIRPGVGAASGSSKSFLERFPNSGRLGQR